MYYSLEDNSLHFLENPEGGCVFPGPWESVTVCPGTCPRTLLITGIIFIWFAFKPRMIDIHIYIITFSLESYSCTKPHVCLSAMEGSASCGTRLCSVFSLAAHQRYKLTSPHKYKELEHADGTTLFCSICCFSVKAYLPGVCQAVAGTQKLLHFFLFLYIPALPMDLVKLVVHNSSQEKFNR